MLAVKIKQKKGKESDRSHAMSKGLVHHKIVLQVKLA